MIVDKLIAAITRTDFVTSTINSSFDSRKTVHSQKTTEPLPVQTSVVESEEKMEISMPLAAATIAALLRHYSSQMEDKKPKQVQKSLPVIPVHA
jgi:hypothetical protein